MKKGHFIIFLYAFFTLVGLSACNLNNDDSTPVIYHISGTVLTQEGQPIKGIKVVNNSIIDVKSDYTSATNTTYTDANGSFSTVQYSAYAEVDKINPVIVFSDVDGTDNGGSFKSYTLQKSDLANAVWNAGDCYLSATIKLQKN